jgi:hypothetical protein
MSAVDLDRLVAAVRELAEEHPDRIAGTTYRNDDGSPSCIIGHAWARIGLDLEQLVEGQVVRAQPGVDRYDERVWWLNTVQELQDHMWTWGSAVGDADESCAE